MPGNRYAGKVKSSQRKRSASQTWQRARSHRVLSSVLARLRRLSLQYIVAAPSNRSTATRRAGIGGSTRICRRPFSPLFALLLFLLLYRLRRFRSLYCARPPILVYVCDCEWEWEWASGDPDWLKFKSTCA